MADPIPIIGGTGALGYGLATRWAQAGEEVVIGSRKAERAAESAERLAAAVGGAKVEGLENPDAARRGPIVFLTVPFRAQSENLANPREVLDGRDRFSWTAPSRSAAAVSGKATRTLGVWQGSAAQQAQEMVPDGVVVVSALHTVSAKTLAEGGGSLDEDILICGDRKADKARVAAPRGANRRFAGGERGRARDGADRRNPYPVADRDQLPVQDPCRNPDHRTPRRRPLGLNAVVLAGGTGGAKLAAGLQEILGERLSVIANSADDIEVLGVHVSPDPDLVTYWLSGEIDEERGWGLSGDSFTVFEQTGSARGARLVQALRPRPRHLHLPNQLRRRGRFADRCPGTDRAGAGCEGASAADV